MKEVFLPLVFGIQVTNFFLPLPQTLNPNLKGYKIVSMNLLQITPSIKIDL